MCGVCGMKVYSIAAPSCTLAVLMPHLGAGVDVRPESGYRKECGAHNEMIREHDSKNQHWPPTGLMP
jgi:hypothetical protein